MDYKIEYHSDSFPLWKPNFIRLYSNRITSILIHVNRLPLNKEVKTKIAYLVLRDENQELGNWSESNSHW